MRIPFSAVFNVESNGAVSARTPVEIDGAQLSAAVKLQKGTSLQGTRLTTLNGHDLEVTESHGLIKIDGHY